MRPTSEDELSELVAGATGPLHVRGGGTRSMARAGPGEVLETGGLTGIALHEPGALTLVAKAGTPIAEIEAALEAEGQRLAFEPMDHRGLLGTAGEPTIGGAVAANVSGPRRIQTGACRDFLLGVRFVDGTGAVVKNGGRVMKNVTGYDLVKLMAGSRGTLGVLTEVALKVLPSPETQGTLVLHGLSDAEAVAAMARGLGSPFEVTGAAHLPGRGETCLRIEGFADSVCYRLGRLADLFAGHEITRETDPDAVAARWRGIRDVAEFHGKPGDVWCLSVKPGDAPEIAARAGADEVLFDWGGGRIWARMPEGSDLRAHLGAFAGHATLVRGSEAALSALPVFQPEPAPVAALSAGLRRRFDPRGVLNPGLMG
ncbi:2-hydroxy-acid oxidase [Roseivivax halodurans JCM 10272]|uniref:2-hydroxy-acid oxidase n=1 Tax=Roseivivax halodurans JCM 10272 TaxID=1449350 RepID=X7EIV2_9RHOB|nr:FAD-binding protein [Roseivivax halodurans]ETX15827.1 2-hydroxy-acid oxidase [Roseivivax halodurans JCM 10272]